MNVRWPSPLRLLAVTLALAASSSCKKADPAPSVATPASTASSTETAPPAPASAAPIADPAPPASTDNADPTIGKSDELRFIEANAELLCFEQTRKKQIPPKEKSALLARHGFAGKSGEERFVQLNIRGDRDREWGKRTTDRIQTEMETLCPDADDGKAKKKKR